LSITDIFWFDVDDVDEKVKKVPDRLGSVRRIVWVLVYIIYIKFINLILL